MQNASAVPKAKASVVHVEMRQAAVARGGLDRLENISDPANRVNERSKTLAVHFAA